MRTLTREPDTVSTVGGKDADMGYGKCRIAPGRVCNAILFYRADSAWKGNVMSTRTKRLTESAMLLAVAIVLELVSKMFIPELPFGGQVTLASMLPVVLISWRHGVRWGLTAGVAYACIEMLLGARTVAAAFQPGAFGDGVMLSNALVMCLLDYLAAFTVLGLGGCLRSHIRRPELSLMAGSLIALGARYLCHIGSGCLLYAGWAEWFFTQENFPAWGAALVERLSPAALGLTYSVVYNGMYMIPEMICTAAAALLLGRIPKIVRKVS